MSLASKEGFKVTKHPVWGLFPKHHRARISEVFVPQIVMGGTGSTSKVSVLHKLQSHRLLAKGGGKGATGGREVLTDTTTFSIWPGVSYSTLFWLT